MDGSHSTSSLIELEQEALSVRSSMAAIQVIDQPTYNFAVEARVSAVGMLKRAEAFFDPSISDAHSLHKKLLAQKKSVCEPMETAIRQINAALIGFDQQQERLRRQEQQRLEDEARRQAEDERLRQAAEMETQGVDEETVSAVLDAPIVVTAPVVAAPTYEKSNAVIYRDNWTGDCFDLFALVKAVAKDRSKLGLLQINQPALNSLAKSLKEGMSGIPGVRAVNNKVVATGRG